MSSTIPPSGHRRSGRLGLLALTPIVGAMLAGQAQAAGTAPKITAKAKLDKTGSLLISGKISGLDTGSQVSIYNAADHILLYSTKTNSKSAFSLSLANIDTSLCQVQIEAGAAKATAAVAGAAKTCATAPVCYIKESDQTLSQSEHAMVMLTAVSANKKSKPTFQWTVSDGETTGTGDMLHAHFPNTGLYKVTLKGTAGSATCTDDAMVSVAPPAGTNPNGKVAESKKPENAEALKAATGAYVVLPFEETGMQGGSQVHLPYNAMINYNTLNAQVIQKLARKPPLVSNTDIDVQYSAASNPADPFGANSINSTSQNLFADGAKGNNIDLSKTTIDATSQKPTKNVFVAGHDYAEAAIRKTEQWDRMHQPTAAKLGIAEIGTSFADNQIGLRFIPAKPMAKPDEGMHGYVDGAAGTRKMPGFTDPYKTNIAQAMNFNADQDGFAAQFIPLTDIDDQGRTNPYPLLRVEAKDKTTGNVVAKADAVYTTASETRCRECHLPGGVGSDDTVWRTPVAEYEMTDFKNSSNPGPATGAGSFDPGLDPTKPWPPAIHNRFDDKHPENPTFSNLAPQVNDSTSPVYVERDANGLRQDRVKESRWVKLDTNGNPTNEVSPTKPADASNWRLQVKIKFKSAADYGGDSWVEQEKAALFNTLVMHDYMVLYGPTPASGKLWPASYSSQVADGYGDDVGKSRVQPMYFCSGHHQSNLKFDVGIAGKSFPTNRSDYSRAFHAFHGKMQVYKTDVAAGADGKPHKKGELIRDSRGHPLELGGRGWDSQQDDDNGVPLKVQADGKFATESVKGKDPKTWDASKYTVPAYDPAKNNWRPDLFPMDKNGELLLKFGDSVAMEDNCAKCHTGNTEKSYRDIHHAAGLKCDNCHGDMLAVGNAYPNEGYNANLTGAGVFGADTTNAYDSDATANVKIGEPADYRRPWLDEPDCGSCHIGDANIKEGDMVGHHGHGHALKNVFSAGALKQGWMDGDAAGRSVDPLNARFAVMPHLEQRPELATVSGKSTYVKQPLSQALYRKSADVHGSGANGMLTCSTCHGGSHAIWPNPDPNANDNVTAKQLQGYDGNIAECSVCHVKDDFVTGLVATDGGESGLGVAQGVRDGNVVTPKAAKAYLAGPHGLHPVGDESWWKNAAGAGASNNWISKTGNGGWHSDMTYKPGPDGEDQCAACHGSDHKGTRLSKTLVAREFVTDKGKKIKVEAGQIIGCDLCHTLNKTFYGAPNSKAADGGWPKAQPHSPPKPESITPGTSTGGGGGHG